MYWNCTVSFEVNELHQKVLRIFHGRVINLSERIAADISSQAILIIVFLCTFFEELNCAISQLSSFTLFYKRNPLTSLKAFTVALHHHWTFFSSVETRSVFCINSQNLSLRTTLRFETVRFDRWPLSEHKNSAQVYLDYRDLTMMVSF